MPLKEKKMISDKIFREIMFRTVISMITLIAVIVGIGLLLSSCHRARVSPGTQFADSWSAERCQKLLDQRDAFTWAASFSGGLAGAGGLSTAIPDDDQDRARLGLGISTAVLGAAAASLSVLAASRTAEFEKYCNQEEGIQ
jgi:hypothetical protein